MLRASAPLLAVLTLLSGGCKARNPDAAGLMSEPSASTGQEVAKAMGVTPLKDEEILIGKAEDGATNPNILSVSPVFKDNCPLWTYVLAEAMHHAIKVTVPVAGPKVELTTPQLGPVGGRIVAPMQTSIGQQALVVIDKTTHGFQQTLLEAVHFVPLKSGIA